MNNNRIYCGEPAYCAPKTSCAKMPDAFSPQHQSCQPGLEYIMRPLPAAECNTQCRKLEGKVALITGGDSGIGLVVAGTLELDFGS